MADAPTVERAWFIDIVPNQVRIRCRYKRNKGVIQEYTVQLELFGAGHWKGIVRYDNAHGFCHRDTIHVDGSQEKVPIHRGDANTNFTWAIQDLRKDWQLQRDRYLAELKS